MSTKSFLILIASLIVLGGIGFYFLLNSGMKYNQSNSPESNYPENQNTTLPDNPTVAEDEEPNLPVGQKACVVGGCSGQLCVEEGTDAVTTCEWTALYGCYQYAKCERQPTGKCDWTPTDTYNACLIEVTGK